MSAITYRALAVASAFGVAASLLGYVVSFLGTPVDVVLPLWIPLCLGMIALFVPIYVLEFPASKSATFFWKGFARSMPRWVAPCARLLTLLGLAHLVWYFIHGGLGAPAIIDGQYVLDNRGRVLRVLTRSEYLMLKDDELRAFASMTLSFYFVPMTYWWFHRGS